LTGNATTYDTGVLSTAPVLAEFTGSGNINLPAGTFTQTDLSNTGGNSNSSQVTDAGLTGTVTYTYIPEPGTVSLFSLGGVAALLHRRRRPEQA